jgi:hypothetical protein
MIRRSRAADSLLSRMVTASVFSVVNLSFILRVFLVCHVLRVNNFIAKKIGRVIHSCVKGKSVTFRPKSEVRARLEEMAKSKEWTLTKIIEKAIEAFLNQLERKSG